MLINESDRSRNISFKVETMVNIFSIIYHGICEWCEPNKKSQENDIHQLARNILFESGYHSGAKFGWTMHEIFQKVKVKRLSLEEKIKRWCEFDSDVGFGMLSLVNEKIEGSDEEINKTKFKKYNIDITLSHNFLTYRRETWEINLCSFMCGYIQVVLEKITGQPLLVTHNAEECEQFIAELDSCTYHVETNGKKLVENLNNAGAKFTKQYSPNLSEEALINNRPKPCEIKE